MTLQGTAASERRRIEGSIHAPFAITSLNPDRTGRVNKPRTDDLVLFEMATETSGGPTLSDGNKRKVTAEEPDSTDGKKIPRIGGVQLEFQRHLFGLNRPGWTGASDPFPCKLQTACAKGAVLVPNGYDVTNRIPLVNTPDVESDGSAIVAKQPGNAGDVILCYGSGVVPVQLDPTTAGVGLPVGAAKGSQVAATGKFGLGTIFSRYSQYVGLGLVRLNRGNLLCLRDESTIQEDFQFFRRTGVAKDSIDQIGPIRSISTAEGTNFTAGSKIGHVRGDFFFDSTEKKWRPHMRFPDMDGVQIVWGNGYNTITHKKNFGAAGIYTMPGLKLEEYGHVVDAGNTQAEGPWIKLIGITDLVTEIRHGGPGPASSVPTGTLLTVNLSKDDKGHIVNFSAVGISAPLTVSSGTLTHGITTQESYYVRVLPLIGVPAGYTGGVMAFDKYGHLTGVAKDSPPHPTHRLASEESFDVALLE